MPTAVDARSLSWLPSPPLPLPPAINYLSVATSPLVYRAFDHAHSMSPASIAFADPSRAGSGRGAIAP